MIKEENMQTILIIDDAKENIVVLSRLLKSQANILFSINGKDGLQKASSENPDLILLDISMPDLNGFEVLRRLKLSAITAETPVIFITGIPDSATEERGLTSGAVDYIIKPFSPAVVKARVRHQLKLRRLTSALKDTNSRLTLLAMTDPLTNAYNRRYFIEMLDKEWHRMQRKPHPTSLVMLDIDNFKDINDKYGHDIGDKVIIEVSKISMNMLRNHDIFGRFGGEEFVILLPETKHEEAMQIATRLCSQIKKATIKTAKATVTFTISCGVAESFDNEETETPEQLIKRADLAMYEAKRSGRNKVIFLAKPQQKNALSLGTGH